MEVYEIVKPIGGGSFAQVYLAKHKRENRYYVLKKIKTRDMSKKDRENTENEVIKYEGLIYNTRFDYYRR